MSYLIIKKMRFFLKSHFFVNNNYNRFITDFENELTIRSTINELKEYLYKYLPINAYNNYYIFVVNSIYIMNTEYEYLPILLFIQPYTNVNLYINVYSNSYLNNMTHFNKPIEIEKFLKVNFIFNNNNSITHKFPIDINFIHLKFFLQNTNSFGNKYFLLIINNNIIINNLTFIITYISQFSYDSDIMMEYYNTNNLSINVNVVTLNNLEKEYYEKLIKLSSVRIITIINEKIKKNNFNDILSNELFLFELLVKFPNLLNIDIISKKVFSINNFIKAMILRNPIEIIKYLKIYWFENKLFIYEVIMNTGTFILEYMKNSGIYTCIKFFENEDFQKECIRLNPESIKYF